MKKSTKKNITRGAEIGGAVTAAALAMAAGAYLLSSKKNKATVKGWVSKAKKDIAAKTKTAKKLGKVQYDAIVDEVVKRYGPLEDLSAKDIMMAANDLKAQWKGIEAHAKTLVGMKPMAKKKPVAKKKVAAKKSAVKKARV